jgi:hypothetical protein
MRSRSLPAEEAGSRIKAKFLNSALKSAKIFHSCLHSQTTSLFSKRRFVGREAPEDKNKIFLNNDLNTDFADKPTIYKNIVFVLPIFSVRRGSGGDKASFLIPRSNFKHL